jgi:dTDP-4-amino-4,6-dideoxygalactose transaminase
LKIKKFTPPKFEKQLLDIDYLNKITGKKWIYSSSGKASIYHILKNTYIDKILIPVYICDSVLVPLKKLKIEPVFYDLDIEDLNPSLNSIKYLSKKYNVKAVLVASMYGNPANLEEIEKYCKENDIFMIDDAAQSFGAKLNNKYVGTFGDSGFFSFSPGKPTAGHLGSFFWIDKDIKIKRTKHCFVHLIRWLSFYLNRYKIYETNNFIKKFFSFLDILLFKIFDITDDDICEFEKEIVGGILFGNLNGKFNFRNIYTKEFIKKFEKAKNFRVLKNIRGEANNHKFVLIFFDSNKAKNFIRFMKNNNIYCSNGYKLLSKNLENLPNAKKINNCVVELPIENDKNKINYIVEKVEEFESGNSL